MSTGSSWAARLVVIAGLLAIAGMGVFLDLRAPERPTSPTVAPAASRRSPAAVPESRSPALAANPTPDRRMRPLPPPLPASAWQPLPPESMPLAAAYPVLKSRADRGEAPAACRLAVELGFCREQGRVRPRPAPLASERNDRGEPPPARVLRPAAHCAGVADDWFSDQHALVRQAALAGNLAAIEEYASGRSLLMDMHGTADWLEQYREEAPALADAAVQAGSLSLLWELHVAYDERPMVEASLLERAMGQGGDPERLAQTEHLLRWVLPHWRPTGSYGSSDAALVRQAEQRFATWFGGNRQRLTFGGFRLSDPWTKQLPFNTLCTTGYIADPLEAPPIDWTWPAEPKP